MIQFSKKNNETPPNTFHFSLAVSRIVFMGTPEFAVTSLDALIKAGYQVAGVVTAPDKPAGRGLQPTYSAVKQYAQQHGLPLLQPEKLKDPAFLEDLAAWKADLQVVVAFRMLPEVVWNMPPKGTINLHGSLLPQYRGAAPINWAVINGETQTGVTTFKLQHAIDTGDILLQEKFPIGEEETAGEVHDKMKQIGASVLVRTVKGLLEGSIVETPQETPKKGLHAAPKIFTETARIDFTKTVKQVYDLVRGLSPFPGAFTQLDGKVLKIYRCDKEPTDPAPVTGEVVTDRKTFLKLACADGYIQVRELQLEGKKRMAIEDFLRGNKVG